MASPFPLLTDSLKSSMYIHKDSFAAGSSIFGSSVKGQRRVGGESEIEWWLSGLINRKLIIN